MIHPQLSPAGLSVLLVNMLSGLHCFDLLSEKAMSLIRPQATKQMMILCLPTERFVCFLTVPELPVHTLDENDNPRNAGFKNFQSRAYLEN